MLKRIFTLVGLFDVIFIDNTVIDMGPRQYSVHNTIILNTYIFNTKFRGLVFSN